MVPVRVKLVIVRFSSLVNTVDNPPGAISFFIGCASCVTVMVCSVEPATEMVIFAVRTKVAGLTVAVNVMVPFPSPEVGFTVSQA